jgi:hypothetical protein
MTATFGLALLLQVICIAALRHRFGQGWLRRPAVVLVLGSVYLRDWPRRCYRYRLSGSRTTSGRV